MQIKIFCFFGKNNYYYMPQSRRTGKPIAPPEYPAGPENPEATQVTKLLFIAPAQKTPEKIAAQLSFTEAQQQQLSGLMSDDYRLINYRHNKLIKQQTRHCLFFAEKTILRQRLLYQKKRAAGAMR